jgi:hypothetical protein
MGDASRPGARAPVQVLVPPFQVLVPPFQVLVP